jgi:hypothetical protein
MRWIGSLWSAGVFIVMGSRAGVYYNRAWWLEDNIKMDLNNE